jgi:hypothetical protein
MNPEKALLEAFIVPAKRRRYSELLETKHGRDKIRFDLDHFGDLDPRFCRKLEPEEQNVTKILEILRSLGAPEVCYLVSSHRGLDRREMALSEALGEVVGRGLGTFVSCVPGRLAYFEGEAPKERYICHRKEQVA